MSNDYSGSFVAAVSFVDGGTRYAKGDEVKGTQNHKRELSQNELVVPKKEQREPKQAEPERTQDVAVEKPKRGRPRKSIKTKAEE